MPVFGVDNNETDKDGHMILEIPKNAEIVLHTLENAGYEAYVVGGCVRDSILGRKPDDWDITTSAKPEQVKALFHRTVDTGLQHGTVTVLMEKEGYEVTTYRVDGEYEDGRHPKEVTFTASLEEDLKRRDFTINAMAYNPSRGLVDLFGGLEDIQGKIIRCVGDPLERFTEDALRIMRAVRFSAQLGFTIEDETRKALGVLAPNLKHVSAERIQVELVKLLVSPHPDYLRVAYETGITAEFLPEFDACIIRLIIAIQSESISCTALTMYAQTEFFVLRCCFMTSGNRWFERRMRTAGIISRRMEMPVKRWQDRFCAG